MEQILLEALLHDLGGAEAAGRDGGAEAASRTAEGNVSGDISIPKVCAWDELSFLHKN